jgi:hypothetical protein
MMTMHAFMIQVTGVRPGSDRPQRDLVYAVAESAMAACALVRLIRATRGEAIDILGIIPRSEQVTLGLRPGEVSDAP